MDLLKRERAPGLPGAWFRIDEEARRVLTLYLARRKPVDFEEPFGWMVAAVNTGRPAMLSNSPVDGVQPLVELGIPAELDMMELDSVGCGGGDSDLNPIRDVAERIALAEDDAMLNGYAEANIEGIIPLKGARRSRA